VFRLHVTQTSSPTETSILHQPLVDVGATNFEVFCQKSVRESCIRIPQTRRTPLQTHTFLSPKFDYVFHLYVTSYYTPPLTLQRNVSNHKYKKLIRSNIIAIIWFICQLSTWLFTYSKTSLHVFQYLQLYQSHQSLCLYVLIIDLHHHRIILHQPLVDVPPTIFAEKPPKSVRESCIRIPQTRRTPLQTHGQISIPLRVLTIQHTNTLSIYLPIYSLGNMCITIYIYATEIYILYKLTCILFVFIKM
jgi:hypothetical protein